MTVFEQVRFTDDLRGRGTVAVSGGRLVIRKPGILMPLALLIGLALAYGGLRAVLYFFGDLEPRWAVMLALTPLCIIMWFIWPRRACRIEVPGRKYVLLSPEAATVQIFQRLLTKRRVLQEDGSFEWPEVEAVFRKEGITPSLRILMTVSRWRPGTRSFRIDSDRWGRIGIIFETAEEARRCWEVYSGEAVA